MTLVLCLDDGAGRMFNHRRQSRDRLQMADLLATVGDRRLLVSPYTAALIPPEAKNVTVTETFDTAREEDVVFLEDGDPAPLWDAVKTLVIYRWNRHYPADVRFEWDLSGFRLESREEFPGKSHEIITKEVYAV